MNNNYILARWRDASTDPPPSGWCGLNAMANGARYYGACGYMPGDQWLDITAIPAVPLAAVQAAILEMRGEPPWGCDTWEHALDILQAHCGIDFAPMEATK